MQNDPMTTPEESYQYFLWVEGRLEELRRAGLISGPVTLTAKGWKSYKALPPFKPSLEKVLYVLQNTETVHQQPDELLTLLNLTMKCGTHEE